jgi:alkaline phosphatase D
MLRTWRIIVLFIAAAYVLSAHAYAADTDAAKAKADRKANRAKAKEANAKDANSPQTMPAKAPKPTPYGFREVNDGSLAGCLELLGQFKKPPEVMFRLYEAAYKALAAKKDATFMDVANDQDVQKICKENGIGVLGGPMLGSVRPDGAAVWVRALRPGKVELRVTVGGAEKTFGPVEAGAATDLSAVVQVTGLAPSTAYPYRVLVDGKAVTIPQGAAITTAPKSDAPGRVRIAFGSCFHRWGLGNDKQADMVLSRKPAALLVIGDIAVQDRNNDLGMHRADYLLRDFRPAWAAMTASIPVYAAWDDHDYFHNDGWGIPKGYTDQDRLGVRDVFTKSWANPSYGFNDARGGVFLRARIGSCDVIMVDERYFRTGDKTSGSLLGPEQMKWLKAQLLDCKGPFIIMSCGTMWSDYISNGKDSWGVWDPQGREELLSFIEANRIGGVLMISGDRHGARGFRIPRPSGFKFYEFEPASLGGRSGPEVFAKDSANQLFGMARKYAFGEFTIDATVADPTVEFRLIGDDGTIIHEMKLTRSQLTPPGK